MPTDWLSCAGSGEPSTSAGTEGNNGANTNNNANANTNENNTTTETTQTPSQGSQPQQSTSIDWTSTIVIFGIMIVFVLIMIIPQKRREKKQRQMLDAIKQGDEVRTIGGIYGKVKRVKEDLITITTGPNNDTMTFAKGAIEFVYDKEAERKLKELDQDDDEDKSSDKKEKKKSIFGKKK